MNKTLPIRFACLVLAAFASACFAPEDSDEEEDTAENESAVKPFGLGAFEKWDKNSTAELGPCYHGMSTQVYPIDINAPRCDLATVYDLVYWAESDGQAELKDFLVSVLDGNAQIQCHSHFNHVTLATEWCADVIDRFPNGSELEKGTTHGIDARNFFVAYTGDADTSATKAHWDAAINSGQWQPPPIELSETGFVLKDGQFVQGYDRTWNSPGLRLLKFDPRTCSNCGIYQGPGLEHVTNPSQITNGWWPTFDGTNCNMQQYFGGPLAHMGGATICLDEQQYRATSR